MSSIDCMLPQSRERAFFRGGAGHCHDIERIFVMSCVFALIGLLADVSREEWGSWILESLGWGLGLPAAHPQCAAHISPECKHPRLLGEDAR
eukprot:4940069-Pyramimonas_sp.AAC.3